MPLQLHSMAERAIKWASRVLAALAALLLIAIVVLMMADSVFRFAGFPLRGVLEIVQVSFVCLCFLGFALTKIEGRDINVDILRPFIPGRAGHLADLVSGAFTAGIFGMIAYYGSLRAVHAWSIGDFMPGVLLIPLAIPWAAIAIGSLFAALCSVLAIGHTVCAMLRKND